MYKKATSDDVIRNYHLYHNIPKLPTTGLLCGLQCLHARSDSYLQSRVQRLAAGKVEKQQLSVIGDHAYCMAESAGHKASVSLVMTNLHV